MKRSVTRQWSMALGVSAVAVAGLLTTGCSTKEKPASPEPAVSTTEKAAIGSPGPGAPKNPNDGWEGRPGENGGRPDMTDMGSQPNSNAPAPMNPFPGQNPPVGNN